MLLDECKKMYITIMASIINIMMYIVVRDNILGMVPTPLVVVALAHAIPMSFIPAGQSGEHIQHPNA